MPNVRPSAAKHDGSLSETGSRFLASGAGLLCAVLAGCGGGGGAGASGTGGVGSSGASGTGAGVSGAAGSGMTSGGSGGSSSCPPGQTPCNGACAATCAGTGGGAGSGGSGGSSGGSGGSAGQASGGTGGGGECSSAATYEAETIDSTTGAELDGGWNIWANGAVFTDHDFDAGPARITVRAKGMVAEGTWPNLRLVVGGTEVGQVTVDGADYEDYEFSFSASGGSEEIRVEFDNDFSNDTEDRNLIVDRIVVSSCDGTGGTGGSGGGAGFSGGAGSAGSAGSAGASGSAGAAGSGPIGEVFDECRFHFGTIDSRARDNAAMRAELDYFTPGWMGQSDSFDMSYVCDEAGPGDPFDGIVPAIVSYVIAFNARRYDGLEDCNVDGNTNLCRYGATYIRNHLEDRIIPSYRTYAQGFANCYGTTKPIIFMMEPDYYQYHVGGDDNALSPAEAGQIMGRFVDTIREHLPNAVFSLDISPWMPDNGRDWYSNFDLSPFTFINTSGGGTDANAQRIRAANDMTWAGVSGVTGKPILADTGYGVAGAPTGHDTIWDSVQNINARIADGVVGVAQYNPNSNWGSTISSIRPQHDTPSRCP
jgi:hypothetical protein